MEQRLYDYEGLLRLLGAVFNQAHREARKGNSEAVHFLADLCPTRRKPTTVDMQQHANENEFQISEG